MSGEGVGLSDIEIFFVGRAFWARAAVTWASKGDDGIGWRAEASTLRMTGPGWVLAPRVCIVVIGAVSNLRRKGALVAESFAWL